MATINSATAEDIFYLNEKKEYTLTASCILDYLLTDKRLNSGSSRLWQILYNEAKFNKELKINISYMSLAKKIGKSWRSICRYIKELNENGYLLIKHNFHKNGQDENTLIVRVPKDLLNYAKRIKDREEYTNKKPKKTNLINSYKTGYDKADIPRDDNFVVPKNQEYTKLKNNTTNNIVAVLNNLNVTKTKSEEIEKIKENIIEHEKNVIASGENSDASKNNEFIQQENNTTNIVVTALNNLNENEKKIGKLELEHKNLMVKHALLCKELQFFKMGTKDAEEKFKELNSVDSVICSLEVLIEQEKRKNLKIKETENLTLTESAIYSSIAKFNFRINYLEMESDREISDSLINKIKIGVEKLKRNLDINRIINEIAYAVKFGSLRFSKKTKEEISPLHGINIALKLIKENRWFTPNPLS